MQFLQQGKIDLDDCHDERPHPSGRKVVGIVYLLDYAAVGRL